jgi:hypothetical protein
VIEHEDDLPEVAVLVDWAWQRLEPDAKRIMAVLAHGGGDHMDAASLLKLSRVRGRNQKALKRLQEWHLVQRPLVDRYARHAVVRHAVLKRTRFDQRRIFEHYLDLLEAHPERLDLEQTHLYAAMDYANNEASLDWALRIERLLSRLASSSS